MPGMSTMDMSLMQACMDACSACEQACTVCSTQMMDCAPACMNCADMCNTMMRTMMRMQGMDAGGHDVDARRLHGDVPDVHGRVHGARRHERGLQDVRSVLQGMHGRLHGA